VELSDEFVLDYPKVQIRFSHDGSMSPLVSKILQDVKIALPGSFEGSYVNLRSHSPQSRWRNEPQLLEIFVWHDHHVDIVSLNDKRAVFELREAHERLALPRSKWAIGPVICILTFL
jgi:hypothetical protein